MALVPFDQRPKATDTILLTVNVTDASGCPLDPYEVDGLSVYFVERDFLGTNFGDYTKTVPDPALQASLAAAQATLCADPTAENLAAVQLVENEIASKSQPTTFFYRGLVESLSVGTDLNPAWLSSDPDHSPLVHATDDAGNPITGRFVYEWNPDGSVREGDYFLCWTWTPLSAGGKLSASAPFAIAGDPSAVASVPSHVTPPEKYDTLLERYLPEVYKFTLSDDDQTPVVLDNLNRAVAGGFTLLENMANQIIDLFDANVLHESLLAFLSNLFGLKLKSDDPTLWRRQIKEAVPVFKQKGTLPGLKAAFAQAGMDLTAFTQYWQLVSPYTWVESFSVEDSLSFTLAKKTVVTDATNSALWLQRAGTTDYEAVPFSYVSFDTAADGSLVMTWVTENLSAGPVPLQEGDRVKVKYVYQAVPDNTAQQLEDYIQLLPLSDQRDENAQAYPRKNWNVRLIAADDPLFTVLVPVRHPFADPIIFGHIRTEFPYGENVYNSEEFNGSTRPSTNPCDIDKDFEDPCGACLSSTYSIDLGVEELSSDRMAEAQQILREYTPFHARLHSVNFAGEVLDLVPPPAERIETLVRFAHSEFVLAGDANPFFTRLMAGGLKNPALRLSDLTSEATVLSGESGLAYNDAVWVVTPDVDLQSLGVMPEAHVFEVLAPSANAGTYVLADFTARTARVLSAVSEPVDEAAFTFNLTNATYGNYYTSITQDDLYAFTDAGQDFATLGVKSLWDVAHTPDYEGGPWSVSLPAYGGPYAVAKVEGQTLFLKNDGSLPPTDASGLTYTLFDDHNATAAVGTAGALAVTPRGYVELNDLAILDVHDFVRIGDYLLYGGSEYPVLEFDGNNFWVGGYTAGGVAGATVQIRRHLVEQGLGYFGYRGLRLQTTTNCETTFGMIDGANPPPPDQQTDDSLFKENFLFLIAGDSFKIADINGTSVTLAGRAQDWTTLAAGGTAVTFDLIHVTELPTDIGLLPFDELNRAGKDPVVQDLFSESGQTTTVSVLSVGPGQPENYATQRETISVRVERFDGTVSEIQL